MGARASSADGSIRWRTGLLSGPVPTPRDAGGTSNGRRSWRLWNTPSAELNDDLRPALHDELARLPARFRLPVVLCYLEGLTHAQAAVQLGCGEATLRRRLAEARERLRARLTTRGFAPSARRLAWPSRERPARRSRRCVWKRRFVPSCRWRPARRWPRWSAPAWQVLPRKVGDDHRRMEDDSGRSFSPWPRSRAWRPASAPEAARSPRGRSRRRKSSLTAPVAEPSTAPVDRKEKPSRKHAIKGLVLSPDGKPVSSATVYWLGFPRFRRNRHAMPRGWFKDKPEIREKKLALGRPTPAAGSRWWRSSTLRAIRAVW